MPPKFDDAAPSRFPAIIKAIGILAIVGIVVVSIPYLSGGVDMSLDKPVRSGTNPWGTFRLEYRLFGFDTDRTGGACLIADIAGLVPVGDVHKAEIHDGPCTTKADCEPCKKPEAGCTQIWEGYCVPDGPNQPSRCWYRPADNDPNKRLLCHTSGHHPTSANARGTPWPVGFDQITPYAQAVPDPGTPPFDLQTFYGDHTNGKPAQWRLSGLLFGTQPGALRTKYGKPACLYVDQQKKC